MIAYGPKAPPKVAFFTCTAAWGTILTWICDEMGHFSY